MQGHRQHPGQRQLQNQEAEEVHPRRRQRIPCAVERLQHHHAVGIADVAAAQCAQRQGRNRHHRRIVHKQPHHRGRKHDKEHPNRSEEKHVVEACPPHRQRCAIRPLGAQVLPHQRCRRIAQSPRRQNEEDHDANRDRVRGNCRCAKQGNNPHQPDPAHMRDSELQNRRQRHAQQPRHHPQVETQMPCQHMDALRALQQSIELVEHADAAARQRSQRRARYPEMRKRTEAEDQTRVEDEVDDVRHPQQAHRNRRITRAAKDCVVQEEHDDGAAPAQRNACVARAAGHNLRRRAHQSQQLRRKNARRNPDG